VFGLQAIANVLEISLRKLQYLLELPAGERPPVRHGHRGAYAVISRLQDWVDSQDMDHAVHRELARTRRPQASDPPPRAA